MSLIKGYKFKYFTYDQYRKGLLPKKRGIYVIYNGKACNRKMLYIGATDNVFNRIRTHHIFGRLVKAFHKDNPIRIAFIEIPNGSLVSVEKFLIRTHKPPYNVWVDSKLIRTKEYHELKQK